MTKDLVDTVLLNKHINVTVAKGRPLTIRKTLENYYNPKSWNTQSRGTQIMEVKIFLLSASENCPSYNTFFNDCYSTLSLYIPQFMSLRCKTRQIHRSVTLLPTATSTGNAFSFLAIRTFGLFQFHCFCANLSDKRWGLSAWGIKQSLGRFLGYEVC